MSNKERLMLGGISALVPIVLSLVQFDYQNTSQVLADVGWVGGVGYVFRLMLLFGLGAFFAYIHKSENNPVKIFQLSVGAPALAVGLVTGNIAATKSPPPPAPYEAVAPHRYGSNGSSWKISVFALLSEVEASAQENPAHNDADRHLPTLTLRKQDVMSKIWHGFTGTARRHVWFVIADKAPTVEEAQQKAVEIHQKRGDFHAEVYRP